ncbi:MAG: hypothetical protein KC420_16635 [Myxococcales bacterium]|nr:hypothetical protein [Myxococcales bacterium]MCB9702061.1 hypothetical protein [Myxococcales bacterium]
MNDPIGDDPKHGLKIGGLGRAGALDPAQRADAADEAAATAASAEIARVDRAEVSETAAIADALATGAIDAETAERELIAAVVAAQLPEGASAEMIAAVEAEVSALLAGNPLLRSLLRPS